MQEEVENYKKYLDVVKEVQKTEKESWRFIEDRLYAIASGALALSITLLTFVKEIHHAWIIVLAWILLAASIIFNLVSHKQAYNASIYVKESIFDKIKKNELFNEAEINTIISEQNANVERHNKISLWSLYVGVSFTLIFFIIQVLHY